jgi:hypothetical protein
MSGTEAGQGHASSSQENKGLHARPAVKRSTKERRGFAVMSAWRIGVETGRAQCVQQRFLAVGRKEKFIATNARLQLNVNEGNNTNES